MVIEDSIDTNTKGSFNKVSINKNGKEAKSILKPLKKLDCSSLIEIEILTGRTHQIRAQCCLLYTSPSPRDQLTSRMPSSA